MLGGLQVQNLRDRQAGWGPRGDLMWQLEPKGHLLTEIPSSVGESRLFS